MTSTSSIVIPALSSALFEESTGPIPITWGGTPTTAVETISANPLRLFSRAYESEQIKLHAAPSVNGEDVAAVTVPSSKNAGFSLAIFSKEVALIHPSMLMLFPSL